jgi:hypothetical protein
VGLAKQGTGSAVSSQETGWDFALFTCCSNEWSFAVYILETLDQFNRYSSKVLGLAKQLRSSAVPCLFEDRWITVTY